MRLAHPLPALGGLLFATIAAAGGQAGPHVFTNADLAALFGPAPVAGSIARQQPNAADDEAGWASVAAFIAKEHRQIEADRAAAVAHQTVGIGAADAPGVGHSLPGVVWWGHDYRYRTPLEHGLGQGGRTTVPVRFGIGRLK